MGNIKTPAKILHGQAGARSTTGTCPWNLSSTRARTYGFVEPQNVDDRLQRYLVFFGKYLNDPSVTEPKGAVERVSKELPQSQAPSARGRSL